MNLQLLSWIIYISNAGSGHDTRNAETDSAIINQCPYQNFFPLVKNTQRNTDEPTCTENTERRSCRLVKGCYPMTTNVCFGLLSPRGQSANASSCLYVLLGTLAHKPCGSRSNCPPALVFVKHRDTLLARRSLQNIQRMHDR